jgi:hypothetical protein
MKEKGRDSVNRPGQLLRQGLLAAVGHDGNAVVVVPGERVLRRRGSQAIERGVHARSQQEERDDQENENFKKAFHRKNPIRKGL